MNPVSLLIIAVIVLGLAIGWWRKFSMALTLILVNFLIGVLTLVNTDEVFFDLAGHPLYLSAEYWPHLYTVFTSMFLHAGFQHLWSNMLVLLLLSVPFEERIGRARLLGIYFFGGVVGFLAHSFWAVSQGGGVGFVVGASGAVFAVLGGFATLYPRDPVHFPFFFLIRMPVVVGAIILMAFETVLLMGISNTNISHAAHVGGAAGGVGAALLLGRKDRRAKVRSKIDYARLETLTDEQGQKFVARMKENEDIPEFQRAWFERLLPRLACPTCRRPLQEAGRGRLRCSIGHEVMYEG